MRGVRRVSKNVVLTILAAWRLRAAEDRGLLIEPSHGISKLCTQDLWLGEGWLKHHASGKIVLAHARLALPVELPQYPR